MSEGYFDFYKKIPSEKTLLESVFVAFDFETTGLNPESDSIIEIGAVKFKLDKVIDTYETLVNPEKPIPETASKISGIVDKMVWDKPVIRDILPDFLDYFDDSVLIAHNISFDIGFLNKAAKKMGMHPVDNVMIDTCSFARKVLKGHFSYSLQNLAKQYKIDTSRAHRALDDAKLCVELFKIELKNTDKIESFTAGNLQKYSNTKI